METSTIFHGRKEVGNFQVRKLLVITRLGKSSYKYPPLRTQGDLVDYH